MGTIYHWGGEKAVNTQHSKNGSHTSSEVWNNSHEKETGFCSDLKVGHEGFYDSIWPPLNLLLFHSATQSWVELVLSWYFKTNWNCKKTLLEMLSLMTWEVLYILMSREFHVSLWHGSMNRLVFFRSQSFFPRQRCHGCARGLLSGGGSKGLKQVVSLHWRFGKHAYFRWVLQDMQTCIINDDVYSIHHCTCAYHMYIIMSDTLLYTSSIAHIYSPISTTCL